MPSLHPAANASPVRWCRARSGGPNAPLTVDLNAPQRAPSSSQGPVSGGSRTFKERLVLKVEPSSATVYVDGRAVGAAKEFSGGFSGKKVLQLAPGEHKLRIEAAGYRAIEYTLQVVPAGANDKDTLSVDLQRD